MPTLRLGEAVPIRLQVGDSINIETSTGSAFSVFDPIDFSVNESVSGSRIIGPFVGAKNLLIKCTAGAGLYSIDSGTVQRVVARRNGALYVGANQIASAVAGSGVQPAKLSTLGSSENISIGGGVWANISITLIGDSIAAYGDGSIISRPGPTSQSIPAWAFAQLGLPLHIVANRAGGGSTIDGALSSQVAAAMADDSDIIWIHSGINNINVSLDPSAPTVDAVISKMRKLLEVCASKPLVILDAITPLASTSTSASRLRVSDIPKINAGYLELSKKFSNNVMFNDVYTGLAVDATSGIAKSDVTQDSDGIHLTSYGAYLAGVESAKNIRRFGAHLRPRHRPILIKQLPELVGTSGTKTADSGVINGDVATGCNIEIASNSSGVIVDASVGAARANSQRIRIRNGNAAATVVRFQLDNFAAYVSGLASGQKFRSQAYVEMLSQTGLYRHDFNVQQNPSSLILSFYSLQKSPFEDGTGDSFPKYPSSTYVNKQTCIGTFTALPTSLNVTYSIEVAAGGDVMLDLYGWTFEVVQDY